MECYVNADARSIAVVNAAEVTEERAVAGVGTEKDVHMHGMKEAIVQLTERMKMLEEQLKSKEQRQARGQARGRRSPPRCWTCGRLGHTARFCDDTITRETRNPRRLKLAVRRVKTEGSTSY